MHVAIISPPSGWHVEQLSAAGRGLGHEVTVVEFRQLTALLGADESELRLGKFDLMNADRVLVRSVPPGSLEQIVFRMDALHRLQLAGVPVLNPPAAIEACVDKYLAIARLQAAGLPVPRTAVCEDVPQALAAFHRLGKDVVVKPVFGSEGRGIMRVENEALADRVFRTLVRTGAVLYLQEFIDHPGHDLRALVLGNRVLAAMRRFSTGDFRTNVAQGGRFEAFSLSPAQADLALRAARAVGAPLAGVDLLPDRSGDVFVVEVNSAPGFAALSQTTDLDVAREIMGYLAKGNWT